MTITMSKVDYNKNRIYIKAHHNPNKKQGNIQFLLLLISEDNTSFCSATNWCTHRRCPFVDNELCNRTSDEKTRYDVIKKILGKYKPEEIFEAKLVLMDC